MEETRRRPRRRGARRRTFRPCPRGRRSASRHRRALRPGGWPTTAFLTSRAIAGGARVGRDRGRTVTQAAAAFETRAEEVATGAALDSSRTSPPCARSGSAPETALIEVAFGTFDEDHGGFGAAPKFRFRAHPSRASTAPRRRGSARGPRRDRVAGCNGMRASRRVGRRVLPLRRGPHLGAPHRSCWRSTPR